MARGVRGQGSVTRLENKERAKCRKWRLRVPTEQGPKTKRYTGTYSQALKALEAFRAEIKKRSRMNWASVPTFKEYAESWYEYRKSSCNLATRTIAKNRNVIRLLNWHLADFLLTDITVSVIKSMYTRLGSGDSPSGKCLSGTYRNDAHIVLNQILQSAMDDKLIDENPCNTKTLQNDKPQRDTEERTPLSDDQLLNFLLELEKREITGHTIALRLAVLTGLRRSEIVALEWQDYDEDFLIIRHASENSGELKGTKSKASEREIPLDQETIGALNAWRELQKRDFKEFGIPHTETTRIVTTLQLGIMKPDNLDRWWSRNRGSFGLDGVGLHTLRHTYLSALVHSGANIKVAQSIAGHSTIDLLMKIYAHRNREAERRAVDGLMNELQEKRKGTT